MKADEALFWQCFVDLDSSRSVGMESGPIPPSEVEAWCRLHGFECAQLVEDIWTVTHLVDQHRMSQVRENSKSETNKAASKNAHARSRN